MFLGNFIGSLYTLHVLIKLCEFYTLKNLRDVIVFTNQLQLCILTTTHML